MHVSIKTGNRFTAWDVKQIEILIKMRYMNQHVFPAVHWIVSPPQKRDVRILTSSICKYDFIWKYGLSRYNQVKDLERRLSWIWGGGAFSQWLVTSEEKGKGNSRL